MCCPREATRRISRRQRVNPWVVAPRRVTPACNDLAHFWSPESYTKVERSFGFSSPTDGHPTGRPVTNTSRRESTHGQCPDDGNAVYRGPHAATTRRRQGLSPGVFRELSRTPEKGHVGLSNKQTGLLLEPSRSGYEPDRRLSITSAQAQWEPQTMGASNGI